MEIKEIKEKKREFERVLTSSLNGFMEQTGTIIDSVDLQMMKIRTISSIEEDVKCINVRLNIKL